MKELVRDVIIAVVLAVVIIQFVRPTIVKESSMEPTLYQNNYLLLSKQAYRFGEMERGDIIVFKSTLPDAKGNPKLLIKRIIGLPGEHLEIRDNQVYIDGTLLEEEYIKEQGNVPGDVDVTIGEDEIFAMGDNREVSVDSRSEAVGCVKINRIVGKAFVRLYPFNKIRRF